MTIKVTPELLADIKTLLQQRMPIPFEAVLKWNRNQARNPAGSTEGGRWAKGGGSGSMYGTRVLPSSTAVDQMPQGLEKVKARGRRAGRMGREDRERREARDAQEMEAIRQGGGVAGYATILNAPTGTGFKNVPRAVGTQAEAMVAGMRQAEEAQREADRKAGSKISVLKEASVESTNPLNTGSNASVVVEFDDEAGTKALLKPEAGEAWDGDFSNHEISEVITNRDFSLAEREVIAFEIGETLFGADNPVPETVLRESISGIDIDDYTGGGDDGGGYDEDYAREQYDEYKEKAQEAAIDQVGEEMYGLYQEAQQEHFNDIEKRAEEIEEIWNEEVENFPDNPAGTGSALREHPVLPLGSKGPFERRDDQGALDPLEVLDEANVGMDYKLSDDEKVKVRAIIRKALEDGYSELGDVDEEKAREHLEYDDWRENHEDTENRLYESKIQTFTSWRQSQGYNSGDGGGGGAKNPDAPHPRGGSLQLWHDDMEEHGYTQMPEADGARMAVLDYVIGSMDRHPSNLGFVDGRPLAIDNGYSMPAAENVDDFQFRSVAVGDWKNEDHARAIPESIRQPIIERLDKTDWEGLIARHLGMNSAEREALLGRVKRVREALTTEDGLYALWESLRRMRR